MRVAEAWILYILVVLGVFIILTLCKCFALDILTRLFLAFLIGVILILILIPGITSVTADERTWYSLLLIVTFFVPLVLALWMLWSKRDLLSNKLGDSCTIEKQSVCDSDGYCRIVSETRTCGNQVETRHYE